jgi:hypothetical protein
MSSDFIIVESRVSLTEGAKSRINRQAASTASKK